VRPVVLTVSVISCNCASEGFFTPSICRMLFASAIARSCANRPLPAEPAPLALEDSAILQLNAKQSNNATTVDRVTQQTSLSRQEWVRRRRRCGGACQRLQWPWSASWRLLVVASTPTSSRTAEIDRMRKSQIARVEIAARVPGAWHAAVSRRASRREWQTRSQHRWRRECSQSSAPRLSKSSRSKATRGAQFLLNFERPRTMGSSFESVNLNKSSVTADLHYGCRACRSSVICCAMPTCSSPIRVRSRVSVSVSPTPKLARDFPHLVVASLSAWGGEGL
jgi:hypothetical protein